MRKRFTYINAGMLAAGLFFLTYASVTLTPSTLSHNTSDMLAAAGIGMTASVSPNQYNTLAEQLSAKEAELNRQEAQLNAKGYGSAPGAAGLTALTADRLGFYSLCMSTLLFILVAVNFYYDVRRSSRKGAAGGLSVDLR